VDNHVTDDMNGKRPFEERVFARFDSLDGLIRSMDGRIERLESRVSAMDARIERLESSVGAMDSRIQGMDSRLEKLEARSYDTKPIWEQALKEIVETRRELVETRRELRDTRKELTKRLERVELVVLKTSYDLGDLEDRLEKLEGN
jgi:chromosome segregation ATPase